MQIGDLSRRAGVNIETIRYYERIGVLPKPARQSNGRRTYSPVDARRLGFVRHARDLGFDLSSIRELLPCRSSPRRRVTTRAALHRPSLRRLKVESLACSNYATS